MHCIDCQSRLSDLGSLFDTHKGLNDAFARPLHSNLEDLGSCADLGECQLCVVAYHKALTCLENLDTVDKKSLRVRLPNTSHNYGSNPQRWFLTFQLQLKGGAPMWKSEPDWGYVPHESLSSVGRVGKSSDSKYELIWMSYKLVQGKSGRFPFFVQQYPNEIHHYMAYINYSTCRIY
jgi:hypothetical protein